ncbi:hypothetical protein [Marinomonas pollencensis]|uniref:Uncharacterized protein n=1 Tax=Marinomonas pollencensis TaxID=491954 RepID=A0A3E0DVB0_9GAMM|nr:hypothetical protein [Marinomonas pollencensis]REG86795.1 hypothetical protein DFP81_101363 [Marinomonas pollencensis]
MKTDKASTWFPAKKNGWGWGKPNTWQGWFVLGAYFIGVATVSVIHDPKLSLMRWAAWVAGLSVLLIIVYIVKGAPPSWKWQRIKKKRLFK